MKQLVLFAIICALGFTVFGYFYNNPNTQEKPIETDGFVVARDYMQVCLPMTPIK